MANEAQTTTTSVSAPAYLQPYYQRSLDRAESAATESYKPYTGQLTANLSPLEGQAANNAANLQTPGQFTSAGNAYNQAAQGLASLGNYNPTTFSSGYSANQIGANTFGAPQAQQYMNPYLQNVTAIQTREAEDAFAKQQAQLRARVASAGGFGGSRGTLLESEAQRGQNQLLSDIQQKGLADAYTNAQGMFDKDRTAGLAAFEANERARQTQAQLGLDAQGQTENSRQFGANLARTGAEGLLQAGQGLASLGTSIGNDQRANIATQVATGQNQREQQQLNLNNQYQQFLEERGYPAAQAKAFSDILSNVGSNQRVTTETKPQTVSDINQILATLTSGAGLLGQIGGNNGISGGASSLLNGLGSLFSGASEGLSGIGSQLGSWLSNLFSDD